MLRRVREVAASARAMAASRRTLRLLVHLRRRHELLLAALLAAGIAYMVIHWR
jgi:hypothetical protein